MSTKVGGRESRCRRKNWAPATRAREDKESRLQSYMKNQVLAWLQPSTVWRVLGMTFLNKQKKRWSNLMSMKNFNDIQEAWLNPYHIEYLMWFVTLYHGKSSCFTTIWENIFWDLFPSIEQANSRSYYLPHDPSEKRNKTGCLWYILEDYTTQLQDRAP